MTIAICTECGKEKFGAFSPCGQCAYTPSSDTEKAKSVMLSDHHYTQFELRIIGESIRSGKPITYDPAILAEYVLGLEILESEDEDD